VFIFFCILLYFFLASRKACKPQKLGVKMREKNIFRLSRGAEQLWVSNQRFAYLSQIGHLDKWQRGEMLCNRNTQRIGQFLVLRPKLGSNKMWQDHDVSTLQFDACGNNQVSAFWPRRWGCVFPPNDVRFSNSHIVLMGNCPFKLRLLLAKSIQIYKRNRRWRLLQLANPAAN